MTAPTSEGREELQRCLWFVINVAPKYADGAWAELAPLARALLSSPRVDGITAQCAIDEVENAFLAAACKDFELLRDIRKRLRALSPPAKDPSHG